MDFLDHMIDACSAAEAGFYFEEGGCIGMAIALHETLRAEGHSPTFVVLKQASHVAVALDLGQYDHQGKCFSRQECEPITLEELHALAKEWNSDLEADTAWAREIIALARDFASAPGPAF